MKTRIVGFLCDWCSRVTADTLGMAHYPIPASIKIVGVTCTGRVDPLFLINAFLRGADGVLVMGCQPGQCHFKEGNYFARRRMALLKNIFETLDLDADRLRIKWIPETQARHIAEMAAGFEAQLEGQGPNPLRSELFI
jgi:F420-non-reducing hydrogenase iron-sulfur subunit